MKTRNSLGLGAIFFGLFFSGLISNCAFAAANKGSVDRVVKIGILVPISLPAMDQIVAGYEEELTAKSASKIEFVVKNAQGNVAIQQAILQEFLAQNMDVIAPIGTDATQMAIHMDAASHKNIPIVAIAAEMPKSGSLNNFNATNVLDEVSVSTQMNFIHQAMPDLKKMTLIYSADDRIFAEVKLAKEAADAAHIQLQTLMIQALPDLYTVHDHIDADSGAIFILKDELVVSGVRTLVQEAERRHIAVIASDDGSVKNGAAFSFGVRESDIGKYAALSTVKILTGTKASEIPEVLMTHYTVFVNEASAKLQGVNVTLIQNITKKEGLAYDAIQ